MTICKEGEISKFVEKVSSVSFSAKRAIENGQKVLYVYRTLCFSAFTPKGLKLIESVSGCGYEERYYSTGCHFEVEV